MTLKIQRKGETYPGQFAMQVVALLLSMAGALSLLTSAHDLIKAAIAYALAIIIGFDLYFLIKAGDKHSLRWPANHIAMIIILAAVGTDFILKHFHLPHCLN